MFVNHCECILHCYRFYIYLCVCVCKDQQRYIKDKFINNPTYYLSFIFSLKWLTPDTSHTQPVNSEQFPTRNKRVACFNLAN